MDRRALPLVVLLLSAACEGQDFRLAASTGSSAASTSGGAGAGGGATAGSASSSGAAATSGTAGGGATGGGSGGSSGAAGGMTSDVKLPCDLVTCDAGQSCCHDGSNPDGDDCGEAGTCGPGEVTCAGPADCSGGELCCMTDVEQTTAPHFTHIVCKATCDASGEIVMCTGDATVCLVNQGCYPSTWLGRAYQFCDVN